jgi:ABC-type sugar transport system ATPase subunit
MPPPVIEARDLAKSFSGVPALRGATLSVAAGEVVAVMGENGAGKTTLMRILSGALPQDSGTVQWPGGRASVGMVHQEAMLAPHLTVAQNLYLGREPQRAGFWLDNRATLERAARFLEQHHLTLDPAARVMGLNAAQKQMLELARALCGDPRLLILDEPTSSLSESHSREVLRIVEDCRNRGLAILYISHRFEEARRIASRVMVLRDGQTVHTGDLSELTDGDLVRHMAGHIPAVGKAPEARQRAARGAPLLHWQSENLELTLHAGEIVGLAGLMGAGRTELCESLFGVRPRAAGRLELLGKPVKAGSPSQALRAGLVYLSEDRQRYGVLQGRALRENITIAHLPVILGAWLALGQERQTVSQMITRLAIRGSPAQAMQTLSGGNQQKGLLARWMLTQARVFLLDEPTRGIDVNAKEEVFALMEELASQSAAILMVSSEIPELLRLCDRLLVMRDNRIVRELIPDATSREEVLQWAL